MHSVDPASGFGDRGLVSRRAFLVGGLGTAAALSAGTYAWLRQQGYAVDPGPPRAGPPRSPVADLPAAPFDARAHAVLAVLIDQLLPGDPELGLPSAGPAGVLEFLDAACRHRGLRAVRADVLKLCRDLDLRARRKLGTDYAAAPPADRDALLAAVRLEPTSRGRYSAARALRTTVRICLEGYLGHPRHLGNRDFAVWRALEIPMPHDVDPKGHQH